MREGKSVNGDIFYAKNFFYSIHIREHTLECVMYDRAFHFFIMEKEGECENE